MVWNTLTEAQQVLWARHRLGFFFNLEGLLEHRKDAFTDDEREAVNRRISELVGPEYERCPLSDIEESLEAPVVEDSQSRHDMPL